jgi:hypothetical protein
MDKDTAIANVLTLSAAGLVHMGVIPVLTIISLAVAIVANLLSIRKNIKDK